MAKNPYTSQEAFCYSQELILPGFIQFGPIITPHQAVLVFHILNKLGTLVAKNPTASQVTFCYGWDQCCQVSSHFNPL